MFLGKNIFLKHGITENAKNYKVTLCRPSGFVVGYIRYCHAYMIKKEFGISGNFRAVLPVWSLFFQKKCTEPYIFLSSIRRDFGVFYKKEVISRSWKHEQQYFNYSYRVKPSPSTFLRGYDTPGLIFYSLFAFSWKTRKFWTKFHMDLIRNVKGSQKLQLHFSKDNCCGTFSSKKMCKNQYLIHNSITTLSWVTDFFKSSVGVLALMIIITCCQ